MTMWFTSDLHFSHYNMTCAEDSLNLCNRPWATTEEMDAAIIDNWNSVVETHDEVFVLGDVAMGKIAESLPKVKQLHGHKYLVPGNHDRCWFPLKKSDEWVRKYFDAGFEVIFYSGETTLSIDGYTYKLSHFPYAGDSHDEDRYSQYRPEDNGEWLLHGHVHDKWKVEGRQFNVGIDVWDYFPVSEVTVHNYRMASEKGWKPWPTTDW